MDAGLIKELIKQAIPPISVVISLIAIFVSWRSDRRTRSAKEAEMSWTLRSQLGDVVTRIAETQAELQDMEMKLRDSINDPEAHSRYSSKRSILSREEYSTVRQAVYLIGQITRRTETDLVSDQEFAIVARALGAHDDHQAWKYWTKAIETSEGYYKVMHMRDCAKFLFAQGHVKDGREQYEMAVRLSTVPSVESSTAQGQRFIWEKMWIYIEWARSEQNSNELSEARRLFKHAQQTCDQLGRQKRKEEGLRYLSEQQADIFGVSAQTERTPTTFLRFWKI